jgi:hypothetical protein
MSAIGVDQCGDGGSGPEPFTARRFQLPGDAFDDGSGSPTPCVDTGPVAIAYTAGNENPQLDVVLVNKNDECCAPIFTGNDVPLNADWQPKP